MPMTKQPAQAALAQSPSPDGINGRHNRNKWSAQVAGIGGRRRILR
jgi:hypothetical protein